MPTWTAVLLVFPSVPVQYRWHILLVNLGYFAGLHSAFIVDLHRALAKPEHHHAFEGHGWNLVILFQLCGKRGRHDLPVDMGWCTEMPFTVLASIRSHKQIELHFVCC
jgi:hypothetical protein